MMLNRLDIAKPSTKVEPADKHPDDASPGIGIESFVEGGPTHFDLIALRNAKPRHSSARVLSGLGGGGLRKLD